MHVNIICFINSYQVYKARKLLAAIDWNFHAALKTTGRYTRKYNKRTKTWTVKTLKETKGYEYIPMFLAKIFEQRDKDDGRIARHVSLDDADPTKIQSTIGAIPPPPTSELVQKTKSRFETNVNHDI